MSRFSTTSLEDQSWREVFPRESVNGVTAPDIPGVRVENKFVGRSFDGIVISVRFASSFGDRFATVEIVETNTFETVESGLRPSDPLESPELILGDEPVD